jgi:hypothetical protein
VRERFALIDTYPSILHKTCEGVLRDDCATILGAGVGQRPFGKDAPTN